MQPLPVSVTVVSPDEFEQALADIELRYVVQPTPFGEVLLVTSERGICQLAFVPPAGEAAAVEALRARWPAAELVYSPTASAGLITRIFHPQGTANTQPLALWVSGSRFEAEVWRTLLRIPFGGVLSYRQVAAAMGKPQAARAVGRAVAKNFLAYIIPCHRVLAGSGEVGRYRWGEERKAAMVAWEALQVQRQP